MVINSKFLTKSFIILEAVTIRLPSERNAASRSMNNNSNNLQENNNNIQRYKNQLISFVKNHEN